MNADHHPQVIARLRTALDEVAAAPAVAVAPLPAPRWSGRPRCPSTQRTPPPPTAPPSPPTTRPPANRWPRWPRPAEPTWTPEPPTPAPIPPIIDAFDVQPGQVLAGVECINIGWSVNYADSITLFRNGSPWQDVGADGNQILPRRREVRIGKRPR